MGGQIQNEFELNQRSENTNKVISGIKGKKLSGYRNEYIHPSGAPRHDNGLKDD